MSEKRENLLAAAKIYIEERIARLRKAIDDLEAALKLETKCSMGDKYETGRAMLHLEFEKLSGQLEQYGKLKKTLNATPLVATKAQVVEFGCIVYTGSARYFIAIPAGELKTSSESFYAVGMNSPVARAMLGKKVGEDFFLNGNSQKILAVE